MRALALLCLIAALAACTTPELNGRASQHGPDRVVVGFPW